MFPKSGGVLFSPVPFSESDAPFRSSDSLLSPSGGNIPFLGNSPPISGFSPKPPKSPNPPFPSSLPVFDVPPNPPPMPPLFIVPISESFSSEALISDEPFSDCPSEVEGMLPFSCPFTLSSRKRQKSLRALTPCSNSS